MAYESGIRPQRLEYARESTFAEPPTDPSWQFYSDSIQSWTPTFSPVITERRRVGVHDVQNFVAGAEDHELEIVYDLQQAISDGGDASYDGMDRDDTTGEINASHTVVARDRLGGLGEAGGGSYMFTVSHGAKVNTVNLSGEPESGEPIVVTLGYMVQKQRVYRVDWPSASTTLEVASTDAADTSQTLTIEDEDASTTEQVALSGTTASTTTASFASIDAARLDAETEGDVTISDGSGNELMRIYGKSSYQDREGDLGIPLLGSGSHASAINADYENLLGDTITRGGSTFMDTVDINSMELSVDNGIETNASYLTIGKRLNEGPRSITVAASIFGEHATYDSMVEHLTINPADIVWTLSNTTITVTQAVLTDLGSIAKETDQAVMIIDNTFTGETLTLA